MKIKLLTLIAIISVTTVSLLAAPGDLDPTFNGSGILIDSRIRYGFSERAMIIQPDGKILAIANQGGVGKIARYNPSGSPDASFGAGGIAELIYPDSQARQSVAIDIQPDGKLVLAIADYTSGFENCSATRLNSDGSIDLSFGTMGRAGILIPDPSGQFPHRR